MARVKAYTDIEQSNKLAKILPLESADMFYREWKRMTKDIRIAHVGSAGEKDLPCWSLASLLGVLPKRIEIVYTVYELSVYLYGLYYWNINNGNLCFESKDKDNLVDACYEMIILLSKNELI